MLVSGERSCGQERYHAVVRLSEDDDWVSWCLMKVREFGISLVQLGTYMARRRHALSAVGSQWRPRNVVLLLTILCASVPFAFSGTTLTRGPSSCFTTSAVWRTSCSSMFSTFFLLRIRLTLRWRTVLAIPVPENPCRSPRNASHRKNLSIMRNTSSPFAIGPDQSLYRNAVAAVHPPAIALSKGNRMALCDASTSSLLKLRAGQWTRPHSISMKSLNHSVRQHVIRNARSSSLVECRWNPPLNRLMAVVAGISAGGDFSRSA